MTTVTPETHPALYDVFAKWEENGVTLDKPATFQPNCFSSFCSGYDTGMLGYEAATHRAYERGKRDATRDAAVARWIFAGAGLVGGILIGIASVVG